MCAFDVMKAYNERKKKEEEKKGTASSSSTPFNVAERYETYKRYDSIDTSGVDDKYINTFISDANNFFKGAEDTYKGMSWNNASSVYDSTNSTWNDLKTRQDTINAWLYKNKSRLTEESYKGLSGSLNSIGSGATSLLADFEGAKNFYAQFDTEDSYNQWQAKEDEKKEIMTAEDFEEYSQKGADIKNPSYKDAVGWLEAFGRHFGADPIKNKATFIQDENNYQSIMMGNDGELVNPNLHFLTEDEVKIYNYYLGKGETEKAEDFLASLEDTLNQRWGGEIAENMQKADLEWVMAINTGLDQFASGVKNLDNFILGTEGDSTSAIQYAGGVIRENIESDFWRGAWDLGVTISNQLPSILVGTLTGSVGGLATMGASVLGNSYAEMRNLGYDEWQSRGYATLVTAAEVGLEKLLGGYTALGGDLSQGATEFFASKVDNALAKLAIRTGGKMASEGLEEMIQSVLEPTFKSFVTGDTYDIDWSEVIYSGVLGALSAGVLEGVPNTIGTAVATVDNYQTGKSFKKAGGDINRVATYIKENGGTKFSADSIAYRLAGKVDENTGVYKIGKLLNEANATLTEMNKSDITKSLERKGIKGKNAELYINALNAVVEGHTLTDEQISALDANKHVAKTLVDVIINPNSTVNQRMEGYTEAINMAMNGGGLKAETAQNPADASQADISSAEAKTAKESEFTWSPDGKTIYNNEDVSVKEISSIKDGVVSVRLEDGREVNAKDVSFSTEDEALMYEMVANLGVSPETAMSMKDIFNKGNGVVSAQSYRADAPLAYKYGKIGYVKGLAKLELTGDQKLDLFARGRADAKAEAEAMAKASKNSGGVTASKPPKFKGEKIEKNGITYEGVNPDDASVTEVQKASIIGAEILAKSSSLEIHVFKSYKDSNGNIVVDIDGKTIPAPNGMFRDGNKIYLDINAGDMQQGTMLYTMSHEVGHYIRKWNAEEFKALGDFLFEHYEGDYPVDELINREIEKRKKHYEAEGKAIPSEIKLYDEAYEEVVCNSLSKMFADENAYIKLAKLKKQNHSLWAKLGEAIKKLINKLKEAIGIYSEYNPNSTAVIAEGLNMEAFNQLQDMYIKAFVKADENYSAVSETLSNNGIMIDTNTESASLFSVRDLLDSKQQQQVAKALAERFDVTVEEAKNWISAETSLASLILNPKYSQYLDYTADPNEVAIKQNSDYPQGTVDFSPICAKRREFTSVMNNILRLFPNHVFAATDLAKIRSIMQEEGMTIPCGICYVEDRRQLDTIVAQNFIDSLKLYREGSKTRPDGKLFNTNQLKGLKLIDGDSYTPSVYELVSLEGLNVLKEKNPNMAEAWVKFNNARGMQSVRLLANEAEYKRQILKYNKQTVKSKNDKGGLRVYSFSDAEMFHLIDIIQVITDSATVGLSLQGYTKVNEYARAVKDTGEKLNRSLIPKGELGYHLEDGKVVLDYDTVEGIDINHPDFFDNRDNPNVGNITIGVSDVQIRAAMVSDFVDQIIPFHTGQSEEVLGEKGISTWDNYKDFQTEKDIATGKVSDHQINIYTEVLQVLEEEGTPITKRTFVEKFLQVCRENNLTPRFSQFLNTNAKGEYIYTEGYHKMLVDFKTFAQTEVGEYLPQKPVKPIFDDKYITKILRDYVKSQKVKDAELAKSMPKVIERITNEIVKPSDTKFSDRDSDGNALSDAQAEYFKDSQVRDKNGNLMVVYHGSGSEFNEFLHSHIGQTGSAEGRGFYFTDNADFAKGYQRNGVALKQGYLNISKPLSDSKKTLKRAEIKKLLQEIDPTGDDIILNYDKEMGMGYPSRAWYNRALNDAVNAIMEYSDSDSDMLAEIANSGAGNKRVLTTIRSLFGYDGYIVEGKYPNTTVYVAFESNQFKNADNKTPTSNPDIRYSDRGLAPTFYSQMGKVVEGMKQDKFAANSVISMLRGRGVKAEEIRWSGIATWLEGKKSVTKQELMEFIQGSQLQIGEQRSGNAAFIADDGYIYESETAFKNAAYAIADKKGVARDSVRFNIDTNDEMYSYAFVLNTNEVLLQADVEEVDGLTARWSQYKLDGGTNYREIVFTLPNSSYSNRAMRGHWGQDAEGVLAHARIQDFNVNGKKMLFIEEIQSDWHNEGHSNGYSTKEYEDAVESHDKLYNEYKKLDLAFHKYVRSNEFMTDPEDVRKKKHDWLRGKAETAQKKYLDAEKVVNSLKEKGAGDTPDAPFKDTYHEYVLKRLLRMAAEEGYDSIGWTPADIQSKRWSDEYAEGYRIEYDQDMPKFLKKYGRQWGAKVEHSYLKDSVSDDRDFIAEIQNEIESDQQELDEMPDADTNEFAEFLREGIVEKQNTLERLKGTKVWSMDITDSMKDSVLHEGQVLYSDRGVNKYGIEVYETSEKIKNLPFKERQKAFLDIMQNQYRGRTAKFIRNGHAYYARFEEADVRKNIYGDKRSDYKGIKAKVNVGADGDIFELVENAQYYGSKKEKGKTTVAHQKVAYWDYFIKTVQIDNRVFDLVANVRKKNDGGYVYSIQLNENKKVEASPPLIPIEGVLNRVLNASTDDSIAQTNAFVNSFSENSENKLSDRDPDSVSNRSLLANALETAAQNDIEKNKLQQYKQKIALIESEEQKLHELREEIKELSFAKGRRDTEKIKSLQFEANQAANRINTYDRQLLNLEASKPLKDILEREKKLAYKKAEQRGKDALSAYREKTAKTTRELMTRYQESRAKATEGRHKTEYRNKIKKVVGDLNQLLLRPTKDKHIKEELRQAVAEALSAINMDTIGAEERVAKYNALIAKTSDPDMIAELTKTRDRIELQGESLKDKLTALQSAYEKIKNSTDPDLVNAYQEPVMNAIKNVVDMVGNTSLRDMNLTQLEAVYEMYSMVLHTVRTANKAFKAKKGETITQISEAVNGEIRKNSKEKFTRNPIVAYLRKVGWTLLKPLTAFRTMGSETFTGLYNNLRNGEDTYYVDINEAKAFIQDMYKKHGFDSWDQKQTKTFTAKSGKTFTLTLEQMMSLYAYSRRNQAHDHIIEGGIVLEDSVIETKNKLGVPIKYKVDTKTAFNISEETLDEICNSLTSEQRAFVEEMQIYLSDEMGAKGNDVSMELLGVKLFKEKFYFPLKSSKYYMGFKPEEAGEIKLKNSSFSKETVQHANNPVVLQNFTDVWATHVNDMSMYHAFVLPLEDFTRVYNYKTRTDANLETMSTEATIANAFGEGATQYIRNFLRSLNGGVRIDGVGLADKAISLTKKGAVLASASVAIQQPSAIMRAMALINPIHFAATTHKSINLVKHKSDWAELKQYAPIAGIKEMGGYDIGLGQGTVDWLKDQSPFREKVDDALGKAPAYMDEITWVSIWNAVKRETASNNKGLDANSEEFLKKAGERFTEVVTFTQVYDSVFSRSDIMRNANPLAKMLTAFMAESSTTLNMLWDSGVQGKRTGKVGGFVKATASTTGAIVGSIVLNAALKSIITAMRDDDEDESYAEKYIGAFVGNTADGLNPLTYIPFVKDIVSIFNGYDVERMDMALFSDLKNAWDAFDSDSKTEYEKWTGLIGAISAFAGIPYKNVERDIRGAYNTIKSFASGEATTGAGIKEAIQEALTGEETSNTQKLYDAIMSGDQAQIDRIKGRFENQDKINAALRQGLRENDSRIREAAQARIDGNIAGYTSIAKEIIAEGNFEQDIVVGAINAAITAIKREEEEANGTTEDSSATKGDEATSIYKASDINTAFDNGDSSLAKDIIQDLIDTKVANGKDENEAKSSLRSSMTSYWKPLYKEAYASGDTQEMYRIRLILLESGLYGSTNDVIKTVQNWLKDN